MNIDRLINMIIRRFARKAISKGIDAGIDRFSGQGAQGTNPHNKARTEASKQMARKAQKGARLVGRLGRF